MDVESLAKQLILQNMTPEQQKAVLASIRESLQKTRQLQKQKVTENVQQVVQALKKIEADIRSKYDDLGNKIEQRVASIKDGKDGKDGKNGANGRDGRDGSVGPQGPRGKDGLNGKDGRDGVDGVSVTDAHIDFDGSLIISLSSGRTINVGEVVAPDLAEKIKVITNGGGTSQTVLDTLASLQTQINNLIPSQTGQAGKFLTTNGSVLSWASVAGGLSYQGTWNASTNSPSLASGVGTNGYYYIVATAGSTNLDGITDWQIGDWLLFNGTAWQKIDQTNLVTSVNGQTGAVSLTTTNINEGTNLYYLDSRARQALSAGTGISYSTSTGVITNSAPDQTVSLTGAGTTTITGTYPNFTISSADQYQGTVTSVTGTSPVTSTGGTTPAIGLASGYGDTQNPYASKTANFVLAAPNGTSGVPTFRAIVAADIPTLNQNTTGTASNVTGIVAVANGGTGLTSGTSGGVPYFSSTTAITSSAVLAANALVVGGGAGAAPATVTTGTGVITALGVNTGTAGAFVVNGGALGTPTSGTVTNLTGTASININGTVGATTPNTGAFTTLSATGVTTVQAGTVSAPAITTSGDTNTGIYFPAADTIALVEGGVEALRIDSTGQVGIGLTPVASNGILQLNSYAAIKEMIETATITASAPSATTNFDVITQAVQYYTSNATTNFTLNIRGNSGTSLNTIMQNGQSVTITLLVTNGATPYYANTYQVDGSGVTPKWIGGGAPTAGNASSIDVYTFTVIKTASATFTVLASQTRFA